jgi:hypothetical protein
MALPKDARRAVTETSDLQSQHLQVLKNEHTDGGELGTSGYLCHS